jgi:hypothetical protein
MQNSPPAHYQKTAGDKSAGGPTTQNKYSV